MPISKFVKLGVIFLIIGFIIPIASTVSGFGMPFPYSLATVVYTDVPEIGNVMVNMFYIISSTDQFNPSGAPSASSAELDIYWMSIIAGHSQSLTIALYTGSGYATLVGTFTAMNMGGSTWAKSGFTFSENSNYKIVVTATCDTVVKTKTVYMRCYASTPQMKAFINGQEVTQSSIITVIDPTIRMKMQVINAYYVDHFNFKVIDDATKAVLFNKDEMVLGTGYVQSIEYSFTLPKTGKYIIEGRVYGMSQEVFQPMSLLSTYGDISFDPLKFVNIFTIFGFFLIGVGAIKKKK